LSASDPHIDQLTKYDPPLTPLSAMPLHPAISAPHDDKETWACSILFKIPDLIKEAVAFDWRCPGCIAVAQSCIDSGQDPIQFWRRTPTSIEEAVQLSWLVERSNYWLTRAHATVAS
jgi:hypothetical protein